MCVTCERWFDSIRGLSQHQRKCDPCTLNDRRQFVRKKRKLWHDDEVNVLAEMLASRPELSSSDRIEEACTYLKSHGSVRTYGAVQTFIRSGRFKEALKTAREKRWEQIKEDTGQVVPARQRYERFARFMSNNAAQQPVSFFDKCLNGLFNRLKRGEEMETWLDLVLKRMFPPKVIRKKGIPRTRKGKNKRREYARMQEMYKKDRGRTACEILDDMKGDGNPNKVPDFLNEWERSFTADMEPDLGNMSWIGGIPESVWDPIYRDEICESLANIKGSSANGPDGVTINDLRKLHNVVLWKLFNLILLLEKIPKRLKGSRTIFVPKKETVERWNDFRPISLTSVIIRLLHGILARRITRVVNLDMRQRGFMPYDACMENVTILDACIKHARDKWRNIFIALVDITNAFSSVSHKALLCAIKQGGAPSGLVEYFKDLYTNYKTTLSIEGEDREVTVGRGILQGDPCSPILFNMVLDQAIRKLPNYGYKLGHTHLGDGQDVAVDVRNLLVNAQSLADDTNLISGSHVGLQSLINSFCANLSQWGLKLNCNKTRTLSILGDKKRKVVYVETEQPFHINGIPINGINANETIRYLGIQVGATGVMEPPDVLSTWLRRLNRSKLKPQQKLYILRMYLMPRLVHGLTTSKLKLGKLDELDTSVRTFVKKILHLPAHTVNSFIYAPVRTGGLGIMQLRANIPAAIYNRLSRLYNSEYELLQVVIETESVQRKLKISGKARIRKEIDEECVIGSNSKLIRKLHTSDLYEDYDGKALAGADGCSFVHTWISDGNTGIQGSTYVQMLRLRINQLQVQGNMYPGDIDRVCRWGCNVIETQHHVLQKCKYLHGNRINRHNSVVKLLREFLLCLGYFTMLEPVIQGKDRSYKPDIICSRDGVTVIVVDVQIVSGNYEDKHSRKVGKYEKADKCIRKYIKREFSYTGLKRSEFRTKYCSLTISSRGLLSCNSAKDLVKVGLTRVMLRRLVVKSLEESVKMFYTFSRQAK